MEHVRAVIDDDLPKKQSKVVFWRKETPEQYNKRVGMYLREKAEAVMKLRQARHQ